MDCKILRNNRGITMLYVIAALLLAVAVGAALMKMTNVEMGSAGDFNGVTSAAFAAGSAVNAAEAFMRDSAAPMIARINSYISEKTPVDLIGSENSPAVISGNQKYWVQMTGWDSVNLVVQIRATGYGKGGSRKSVMALYKIDELTYTGSAPKHALFLGSKASGKYIVRCPSYVDGGVYIGGAAQLDGWSSGTVVNGTFQTVQSASKTLEMQGTYIINENAYFGMLVKSQHNSGGLPADTGLVLKANAGFEYGATTNTGCAYKMSVHGTQMWTNGTISAEGTSVYTLNGSGKATVIHPSSGLGTATTQNCVGLQGSGPTTGIRAKLGLPDAAEPKEVYVDETVLASALSAGAVTNVSAGQYVTGTWMNMQFSSATKWNGFMVLRVIAGTTVYLFDPLPASSKVDFTDKVIWWIDGNLEGGAANVCTGMYNEAPGAVSLFYIANGGKMRWFGGWTKDFYGYINCATGGQILQDNGAWTQTITAPWRGAIHGQDDADITFQVDVGAGVSSNIYYDEAVVTSFPSGLLKMPAGAPTSSTTVTIRSGFTTLNPVSLSVAF